MRALFIPLLLFFCGVLHGQLATGPMIGHTDLRTVHVWVQTMLPTAVHIEYWPIGHPDSVYVSEPIHTENVHARTATLIATNLEPGRTYGFAVALGDGQRLESKAYQFTTQPLWQHRIDPPTFSVATGSCAYTNDPKYDRPGKGYGAHNEIFETIANMHPDMMLWLGDNIYLREVDLQSKSGFQYRYAEFRALPELQQLLIECPHYAIWDDHDFGPNDADRSFIHSDWSEEVFEAFWANPSYGIPGERGITTQFSYMDIDFFLMDNRMFRTNYNLKTIEPQVWGKMQEDWLIEALKYSDAPYKIVATGGQFLSDVKLYENHAQFEVERQRVLDRIAAEGIENVVFLTGDRHHTELSMVTLEGGLEVYDLTVSPLTSTSYDHLQEPNNNRVTGTVFGERNFAMLTFTGPKNDRVLTIRIYSTNGELVWEKQL